MTITKFNVGQTYSGRFMSDYDSKAHFTILSRTAKTVTFKYFNEINKRGIRIYNDVEQFKPFGTHSMCMIIDAKDPDLTRVEA